MKGIFIALFLPFLVDISSAVSQWDAVNFPGEYCQARSRNKCCTGRLDECSAPILGTLCYCDDFCNRTRSDDCCPDYWSFCKGLQPPVAFDEERKCYHHGQEYHYGTTLKINCNECTCQDTNGRTELMCETNECLVDEDLLERVNRNFRTLGWRASNYSTFWGRRYDEGVSSRLGTIHSRKVLKMNPISPIFDPKSVPRTFDARLKWTGIISRPRDQGWCGASWVLSTVAVASDRFAIMTYGNDQTFLSPQNLLDCDRNQNGCQGGHLTKAWRFIRKFGLVPDNCYPWKGSKSECQVPIQPKLQRATCPANPFVAATGDLHRVGPVYRISGELNIMHEIMTSGPVQATMKVSREFFSYKSGIFRCINTPENDRTAYHSVRIVGWGEELQNNQLIKFWIVSNSWGEWWGEDGYFRILRGVNECSIEEFVIAVWANVEDLKTVSNTRQSRNILTRRYKR